MTNVARRLSVLLVFMVWSVAGPGEIAPIHARDAAAPTVKDLRVGERYGSGTRIRSPFLGISFVVPAEWRASLPGGTVVFLDSSVHQGLGFVHLLSEASRDDVLAKLSEPQAIEAGFVLHPVGSVQERDGRLDATHAGDQDVGVTIALLSHDRRAVVYQVVGRKSDKDLYRRVAEELAASTQFMPSEPLRALRRWYERLSGMMLTAPHGEGDAGVPTFHLCSDGRFLSIMKLTPVPGRTTDPEDRDFQETGTWLIQPDPSGGRLVLTHGEGRVHGYDLRLGKDGVLLDGRETAIASSDRCF